MSKIMPRWLSGLMCLALAACGDPPAAVAVVTPSAPVDGTDAIAVCANCHTFEAGAAHRSGPNLHGVFGRKAATAAGYSYSPALQASAIVWDQQTLDAYLGAPARYVPGTKMSSATPDPAKREAIIQYLSTAAP